MLTYEEMALRDPGWVNYPGFYHASMVPRLASSLAFRR